LKNKTLTQIVEEQCWISRSSEDKGHDATRWWKDLDLNNNVREYKVNQLANEKKKLLQENKMQMHASPPSPPPIRPSFANL